MRLPNHGLVAIIGSAAAALLLAACGKSPDTAEVTADNAALAPPAATTNASNELTDNLNGAGQVLRLEGNDSATFVGGNLVEVNRAE